VCLPHKYYLGDQIEQNHVAWMGYRRGSYRVLVGIPEEKDHLEDLDVHGRIRLK